MFRAWKRRRSRAFSPATIRVGWIVHRPAYASSSCPSGLFVTGTAFAKVVALPAALSFLTSYDSGQFDVMVRAQDYYSFVIMVFVAVGIVFELPVFILGLVRLRVLSAAKLRRNRRIGIVAMAALAVALPGVDPVTTLFEMIPLLLLFEGSIWLAVLFERRWCVFADPLTVQS